MTLRDKWHLDGLLGVGGTAAVYSATHRNGSRVAVKVLHAEMATNALAREMFLWEGHIANAVGHDGVVKVIDDDTAEDGSLFLVTELLKGETLEERRARLGGRLPQSEVLLLTDQLLGVLSRAHGQGIVHRDLKPENVFLTTGGQIKVLDFGIARQSAPEHPNSAPIGTVFGTPDYMAPEQASGLEVDARSDIWTCGAMMFVLLSGRFVHDGDTVTDLLANAMTTPARPLASVAPDVASAVGRVVDRALEFSPDMRWPDADHMQEAVRAAYYELKGYPITAAPTLTPEKGSARLPGTHATNPQRRAVPSTVRPVTFQDAPALSNSLSPRRRAMAVWRGVVVGVAIAAVAWMVTRGQPTVRRPASVAAAAAPVPSAVSAPMVVRSPVVLPVELPQAPVIDPPSGAPVTVVGKPGTFKRAAPPEHLPAETTNCRPPYVVDVATGKSHWKLECL